MFFRGFLIVLVVSFMGACVSNNRASHITSIGADDLTQKKPVNIIVYSDTPSTQGQQKNLHSLKEASRVLFETSEDLASKGLLRLNNKTTHHGDWLTIANDYFVDKEYNWTIKIVDSEYPEIRFQNFSDDIDSSMAIHFRYCKERTIQFANISPLSLVEAKDYWQQKLYSAGIQSLYYLMKGNTELIPTQVKNYREQTVSGTILAETDEYIFVLDGETYIYIVAK